MRHRKGNPKLALPADQRMALIRNGSKSLLLNGQIKTTAARAKQISRYVDSIIAKAKPNTVKARRDVFKLIQDKNVMDHVFTELLTRFEKRNSGFTRIVKLGIRRGDAASVSVLELT